MASDSEILLPRHLSAGLKVYTIMSGTAMNFWVLNKINDFISFSKGLEISLRA